jgi:hypothetical protein
MTPLEKLASLPANRRGLRAGVTLADLQAQAQAHSDLQAATELNAARQRLFDSFRRKQA